MAKYQNPRHAEDMEDTSKYSEELAQQQEVAEEDDTPNHEEGNSWQKRYSDLRRHQAQRDNQHAQELEKLRSELNTATKAQIKFPKSKEEIEAWAKKYPEVADIVQTIAAMKANEALEEGEKRFSSLKDMERNITRREAMAELTKLHPDFEDIRATDEFHDWVAHQPTYIQDALYKNDTDARSAARAIDLYKSDTGVGKKKKRDTSAAQGVNTSGGAPAPKSSTGAKFSESQINKMTTEEFIEKEKDIREAARAGLIHYDLSGGAR